MTVSIFIVCSVETVITNMIAVISIIIIIIITFIVLSVLEQTTSRQCGLRGDIIIVVQYLDHRLNCYTGGALIQNACPPQSLTSAGSTTKEHDLAYRRPL